MALPVLNVAQHELTLPSTGKTLKFRPFLVKEEKILLIALESGEEKDMMNAIQQIISQCILDKLEVNELPLFDVEYIFLQLRSQSIGDIVDIKFEPTCYEKCKIMAELQLDLKDVKVEKPKNHKNLIDLTDTIKIKMRYPRMTSISQVGEGTEIEQTIKVMTDSIEYILDGEDMLYPKDHTEEEMENFINSLSSKQFKNIKNFFDTVPVLRHRVDWECPKCKKKDWSILQGLGSFFG